LKETEIIYEQALLEGKKRICPGWKEGERELPLEISLSALEKEPAAQSLLYEILSDYGFGRADVEAMYKNRNGISGRVFYAGSHRAVFDRDKLIVTDIPVNEAEEYFIEAAQTHLTSPFPLTCERITPVADSVVPSSRLVACLNAEKLVFPLVLRHPRKGDTFIPLGMHGRKLISDYCTDRKMSLMEKEQLWLVCSGKDIVWIVGERIDNRFRVDENTTAIYRLTAEIPVKG
jgi:tRNA(Ile)-lysidine synthase